MENSTRQPGDDQQKDYLLEEESSLFQYEYATSWQRFFNLVIDNLLMNYGLSYLTGFLLGIILREVAPGFLTKIIYSGSTFSTEMLLFGYLLSFLNYLLYYTLCEKLFKGYTLGKLITGTRAIRQDGNELTFKDAILRSLSRLVPFEVFSGFNTLTWHDSWTNTMVVKAR